MSRIAEELKHLGEIEVGGWDFIELLQKDVGDLELSRSLRRLGRIRVTDWEFKDVLPAVDRLAHKEVHLAGIFRRTANVRVTDWEFRDLLATPEEPAAPPPPAAPCVAAPSVDPGVIGDLSRRLHDFLRYLTGEIVERPDLARITVRETEPGVLTARLVLAGRDSATLIGRGGQSAATIRRVLQMAALKHGVHVLLRILSEEEAARSGKP